MAPRVHRKISRAAHEEANAPARRDVLDGRLGKLEVFGGGKGLPGVTHVDEVVRQVGAALAFAGRDGEGDVVEGPRDLQLFPRSRHVLVNGRSVPLSPKSFEVLHLLLDRRNEVLSADDVALAVWGHPTFGSPNFVEAPISRLRARLATAGATGVIETVPRVGYVIR